MDKQQNAKKRKIIKLLVISIFVTIVLAAVFVIVAIATRTNETVNEIIFFGLAAGFLLIAVGLFFVYFKLLRSKWYAQHHLDTRLEDFNTYRQDNQIPDFILPFDGEFDKEKFSVLFDSLLHDFTKDELGGGNLYYILGQNVFNKAKNSVDAFYFVPESVRNTLGLVSEKFAISVYTKQVEEHLATKFTDTQFINCVIVFLHDELSDKGKDFYYNFAGENSFLTASNGAFIKNRFYNYLGIEKKTLKAYFYFHLNSDTGSLADLGHMIEEYLLVERPVVEGDSGDEVVDGDEENENQVES